MSKRFSTVMSWEFHILSKAFAIFSTSVILIFVTICRSENSEGSRLMIFPEIIESAKAVRMSPCNSRDRGTI